MDYLVHKLIHLCITSSQCIYSCSVKAILRMKISWRQKENKKTNKAFFSTKTLANNQHTLRVEVMSEHTLFIVKHGGGTIIRWGWKGILSIKVCICGRMAKFKGLLESWIQMHILLQTNCSITLYLIFFVLANVQFLLLYHTKLSRKDVKVCSYKIV